MESILRINKKGIRSEKVPSVEGVGGAGSEGHSHGFASHVLEFIHKFGLFFVPFLLAFSELLKDLLGSAVEDLVVIFYFADFSYSGFF